MLTIAIKMLMGDRAKYITLVSSLAFVSLLFLQQGGIFCGLIGRTARAVEVVDAPIWVCDPQMRSIDDAEPMLDTDLYRVRSVPGVQWAVPLIVRVVSARLENGQYQSVRLYGLDDATLYGRPAKMLQGNTIDLLQNDAVIIGKAESEKLGSPKLGDTFEINDTQARIVGIADVPRDFLSNPFVFTTYSRALSYLPPDRKTLLYILAAPQPGVPLETAIANIRKTTGLAAYTQNQYRWHTMEYYLENTGIPASIGVSLLMVFVIGTGIAGQTFYAFALQNERFFGALKAMGVSGRTLMKMILLQSLLVGLIGFGIGGGLASIFGFSAGPYSKIAFQAPWELAVLAFLAVLGICLLASIASIRRVLKLEPAVVFHG
ncbi:MAG TPA: ABC transporter permease [Acidobacteriaceae bacterium]|jgi:putative ABC transport system permease protein|nr:ABC transporter permease [Acidobacteriaceae bacterium]